MNGDSDMKEELEIGVCLNFIGGDEETERWYDLSLYLTPEALYRRYETELEGMGYKSLGYRVVDSYNLPQSAINDNQLLDENVEHFVNLSKEERDACCAYEAYFGIRNLNQLLEEAPESFIGFRKTREEMINGLIEFYFEINGYDKELIPAIDKQKFLKIVSDRYIVCENFVFRVL